MSRTLAVCALAACLATLPRPAIAEASSPWWAGLAVATEGYGSGLGLGTGERLAVSLVADPFDGKALIPYAGIGFSMPLFPLDPEDSILEAKLGLDLLRIRARPFSALMSEPGRYSPGLEFGIGKHVLGAGHSGEDLFFRICARPFALRTGDGVYAFLVPGLVLAPAEGGRPGIKGFSLKLFEFTQFYL